MTDRLVPIADIVSRSEALVVAALLRQHGVIVNVGGEYHSAITINPLALGGFRLLVPETQHAVSSQILRQSYGTQEWSFSCGLRRAVLRVWGLWAASASCFFNYRSF